MLTEDKVYADPGISHFDCPTLHALMGRRHYTEIPHAEKLATNEKGFILDGKGHTSWSFSWGAGAYPIEHERNGGIPKCVECGSELIFVAGDDPFAAALR
jgi:hypothetical protein